MMCFARKILYKIIIAGRLWQSFKKISVATPSQKSSKSSKRWREARIRYWWARWIRRGREVRQFREVWPEAGRGYEKYRIPNFNYWKCDSLNWVIADHNCQMYLQYNLSDYHSVTNSFVLFSRKSSDWRRIRCCRDTCGNFFKACRSCFWNPMSRVQRRLVSRRMMLFQNLLLKFLSTNHLLQVWKFEKIQPWSESDQHSMIRSLQSYAENELMRRNAIMIPVPIRPRGPKDFPDILSEKDSWAEWNGAELNLCAFGMISLFFFWYFDRRVFRFKNK